MSVQNALKVIQKHRQNHMDSMPVADLKHLVELAAEENLSCSTEDLKKAFKIDWSMRWLKFSNQQPMHDQ